MSTVHLICGPVGAGKTTRARALGAELGAAVFSIDDWMRTLFAADRTGPPELGWMLARVERCQEQIWKVARQLLGLGIDVVLDLGLMRRDQRDACRALAAQAGTAARLHVVDAPAETRRERVRARNRDRGDTFDIEVDDSTFDWCETWYQAPADDELGG